jgi:hypothetical protein
MARGVALRPSSATVFSMFGAACLRGLVALLGVRPLAVRDAPSTDSPRSAVSRLVSPPTASVDGSSAALAAPAVLPTTEAAPAAVSSTVLAIRRVRGRDMLLL